MEHPAMSRESGAPDFRASAPVRLDFAGGWTDVPPFSDREGGQVVSAAISLRVQAEFEPGGVGFLLQAEDLGQTERVAAPTGLGRGEGLPLHKAALRMLPAGPGTLRTRSAVPPGSGLGSSGALDVALVAALAAARGDEYSRDEIAALGYQLEATEAGLPGGRQDQYSAALGGFNRLSFKAEVVGIEPLLLDAAFLAELERRTVICYTGRSRVSGDMISRVMGAYAQGEPGVTGSLRQLADLSSEMFEALRAADLVRVGRLLSANWAAQQRLDPQMATPEMAALERAVQNAGALGGKAAGAGAGGCMFFIVGEDRDQVLRAARSAGATVLTAEWSPTGVELC
jgi:D-glycero-alpha-D-manno-heptose-7-phosphate kinase